MASLAPLFDYQPLNNAGQIVPGGKLWTYETGTTTPKAVYKDQAGTVPHTNPIVLDTAGRVPDGGQIWFGSGEYTIKFTDAGAPPVEIWTRSDIGGADFAAVAGDAALRADLAGTADPADGGGMSGLNALLDYAARTVGAAGNAMLHAVAHFQADSTGTADATDALALMLNRAKATGRPMMIPGGTYLVRAGDLAWAASGTTDDEAGPMLFTSGKVIFKAIAGSGDEPLLSIHNHASTGGRFITGGYVGPLWFQDSTGDTAPNRHGLNLYGVQYMAFGVMCSDSLKGDLIHLESKGGPTTADGWHVLGCQFAGGRQWTNNCKGWTFNNDTVSQVFNLSQIGTLWNIGGAKGVFRGPGSCNVINGLSVAGTGGIAVDLASPGDTVQGIVIHGAELDAPEYGIRLSGVQNADISNVRITYRRSAGVTWPLAGCVMDEVIVGQVVTNCDIELIHRIDASVTSNTEMTPALTMSNKAAVNYNRIWHSYSVSGFTPSVSKFTDSINASSIGQEVYLLNRLIHDSRIKNMVRAYVSGGNVANGLWAAAGSIVPYSQEGVDDGGNYDTATYKYTVPYLAPVTARATVRFAAPAGTQVRIGIMADALLVKEVCQYAPTGNSQSYSVETTDRFTAGTQLWVSCSQDSGAPVAIDPGSSHVADNRFEITLN